jgi:hypothetical protein
MEPTSSRRDKYANYLSSPQSLATSFSFQVKDLAPHTTKSGAMILTPRLEKPLNSVRSYASTVPGESDEEDYKRQGESKPLENTLFLQNKVAQFMSKRLSAQMLRKKAASLGHIGELP